eukprot:CAMPEP_0172906606 /NCGR_PEP_ID=MMETSP1075-20121228/177209_1 /TAXON_ID=2916 /ORGANISM="Ceratium fusus, Strain PA161109" /LENGTH=42 /DNA_ID= /DNA_START= /DNA_END= /DNA_ORIENTATION=
MRSVNCFWLAVFGELAPPLVASAFADSNQITSRATSPWNSVP